MRECPDIAVGRGLTGEDVVATALHTITPDEQDVNPTCQRSNRLRFERSPRSWTLVLALVAASAVTSCRPDVSAKEAEYWIDRLGAEHMRIPGNEWGLVRRHPEVPAAALRRIGHPVLPAAIDILQRNDESYQKRMGAVRALELLGSAATPAIPELIQQIQDTRGVHGEQMNIRNVALGSILQTGTGVDDARGHLAAALRSPAEPDDHRKRIWTAYALASLDPGNSDAMKVLTPGLTYEATDEGLVRGDVLETLLYLGQRPGSQSKLHSIGEPAATALALALLSIVRTPAQRPTGARDSGSRHLALSILRDMGPQARIVAPALRVLLADENEARLHPWLRGALSAMDQPVREAPR